MEILAVSTWDVAVLNTIRKIHNILLFCGFLILILVSLLDSSIHIIIRILEVIRWFIYYVALTIVGSKFDDVQYVMIWGGMYICMVWFIGIIFLIGNIIIPYLDL